MFTFHINNNKKLRFKNKIYKSPCVIKINNKTDYTMLLNILKKDNIPHTISKKETLASKSGLRKMNILATNSSGVLLSTTIKG